MNKFDEPVRANLQRANAGDCIKIAVLRETAIDERRIAATPETVKKFIALGAAVSVEAGAGESTSIADAAYVEAGAVIADRAAALTGADIVLSIQVSVVRTFGTSRGVN